MKYLIHINLPENLVEKTKKYVNTLEGFKLPQLDLHCTIIYGEFKEDLEPKLISSLEQISQNPFEVKLGALGKFGKDSLSTHLESEELKKLYDKVVEKLLPYMEGDIMQYFGKQYTPHMTIARKGNFIPDKFPLKNNLWNVSEFILSKKVKEWKTIKRFPL